MKIALVGLSGGTHLGGSFARAAQNLGITTLWFDADEAFRAPPLLRTLSWRFAGRRPPRLGRFSAEVAEVCARESPDILVALGTSSLSISALHRLRSANIACIAFSSDDPWNPATRAARHLAAIPAYRIVFTPRRANMEDFRALGCPDVRYLPFGYDEELFNAARVPVDAPSCDVLFVGGADRDRITFMSEFLRSGLRTALVGGYWERYPETRSFALGFKTPRELNAMTATAKVNICLVRRANRDGHVMRSFEIAAAGGCMLAEDTNEHREIFGSDGESVLYFRDAREASERASLLLARPAERLRLGSAIRARVAGPENTYRARLLTMLEAASTLQPGAKMPDFRIAAQ
jgi:spore maturation protein CgeB